MFTCPHCHAKFQKTGAFCPFCGASLEAAPPSPVHAVAPPPPWLSATSVARPSVCAIVALAKSILSLLLSALSFFVLPIWIPAVILSIVGFFKSPTTRRGLAIAAMILCAVAFLLITLFTVLYVVFPVSWEPEPYEDYYEDPFPDEFEEDFPDFFDEFFYDSFFGDAYQTTTLGGANG